MFATLLGRESGKSQRVSTDGLIHRLRRRHVLEGHDGCVNSVYFTPDGQRLLTGSDDTQIIIWDWEKGAVATKWNSGHTNNVFQARQIGVGSKTVVSCAADGQVRLHLLRESGLASTTKIGKHSLRAHKLALDPVQPHCFYSSGEDAFIRHYDIREKRAGSQKFLRVQSCVPERMHRMVGLYSCDVNPTRPAEFCVGGNEEYVHIYDARMIREHRLALVDNPSRGELLVTYNDEHIYLFHPWLKRDGANAESQEVSVAMGLWLTQTYGVHVGNKLRTADVTILKRLQDGSKRRHGNAGSACAADASSSKKSSNSCPPPKRHCVPKMEPPCADRPHVGEGASAQAVLRTSEVDHTAHPEHPPRTQQEAGGGDFAADDDMLQELEDANNAAEAVLRSLFDELVTNNDPAAAQMSGSRDMLSHGGQLSAPRVQGGSSTSQRPTSEPGSEEGRDVAVPSWTIEHEEPDDDDDDEEEDEEEDAGQVGIIRSDWSQDEWDDVHDEWDDPSDDDREFLNAVTRGAWRYSQLHKADFMPPHCLQGYIPEDPSSQWLQPRGDAVVQRFQGHKNVDTVKGVSFLGSDEEYIASGSDCGHLFVWSKRDGMLRCMQHGDSRILNCIAPHPSQPFTLATSGIDDDVKIWDVQDTEDEEKEESLSGLEQTLLLNSRRNSPSSLRTRLFVPFLLGARWDSMDF